jgi:hypothetical protein
VKTVGKLHPAAEEMAPSERTRLGKLGGALFIIGSLAAVPAAAFLEPAPEPPEYLIPAAGVLLGLGLLAVPWGKLPERALCLVSMTATVYVVIGTSIFSDDFAFYLVLIAVYTAYAVRARSDFLWLMAFFTVAAVAPLAYADQSFDELAHHILVTLPVMLVSATVVRYLRDALAERELQYRRFAVEAVTLAERIRGGPPPRHKTTAENVEKRLADLVSETPG